MSPFKYDVFLSFRGSDTRRNFTDHLYYGLRQAGVRAFRDSEELEKGEEIGKLMEAIEESEMFIPIFSRNYAGSKWCLVELEKMVDVSKNSNGQRVILPVFYHVEPAEVCRQTGPFGAVFQEHFESKSLCAKLAECCFGKKEREMTENWREAMVYASSFPGVETNTDDGHEAVIVQRIVKQVLEELDPEPLSAAGHLIGIRSRVREISRLLEVDAHDVRMLVIHGMGGIGKTTVAKVVHDKIHKKFMACCFISNIREVASEPRGLLTLQNKLISDISSDFCEPVSDPSSGVSVLRRLLKTKRVLIILDDVDHESQIRELAIEQKYFYTGSRVIVTARDELAIPRSGWNKNQFLIYEQKKLDNEQSLQLFSWHAFNRDHPDDEFEELSKQVVKTTDGLPLAIEVMGSALYGNDEKEEWNEMIESLGKFSNDDIHGKLKLSYDNLHDHTKAVFLDIACFFNGFDKETAIFVWKACGFSGKTSLQILSRKSLIKISDDCLEMHGVLQEMGRHIIRETQPDPNKQSRLWSPVEVLDVLKHRKGTGRIEAINLYLETSDNSSHSNNVCGVDGDSKNGTLETDGFGSLCNLRLLKINRINFKGSYKKMPQDLKFLAWQRCPLESLPDDFNLSKVAVLDLSSSNIIQLRRPQGGKDFMSLKTLCLSACQQLSTTPNFRGLPCLQQLLFNHCQNLAAVDESIGELKNLLCLSFMYCTKLKELPNTILHLTSLETLVIGYCTTLENLPDCIHQLKSLEGLYASGCMNMKELPNSIFKSTSLKHLYLGLCLNLERLPNGLPESAPLVLEHLDLSSCQKLIELPACITQSRSITNLNLKNCVAWKGQLLDMENLETLRLSSGIITRLPDSFDSMKNLRWFRIDNCINLQELPDSIGNFLCLESFSIRRTPIKILPHSIGALHRLKKLKIVKCNHVSELPESVGNLCSLSKLVVEGSSIKKLPMTVGELTKLEVLDLSDCSELRWLPSTIGGATRLIELLLDGTQIEMLPESIGSLQQLELLSVRDCNKLLNLPPWVGKMDNLQISHGSRRVQDVIGDHKVVASIKEVFYNAVRREDVINFIAERTLKFWAPPSDKDLGPREIFLKLLKNNFFKGSNFDLKYDNQTYDSFLLWRIQEFMDNVMSGDLQDEIANHGTSDFSSSMGPSTTEEPASGDASWVPYKSDKCSELLADELMSAISQATDQEILYSNDLVKKLICGQAVANKVTNKAAGELFPYLMSCPVSDEDNLREIVSKFSPNTFPPEGTANLIGLGYPVTDTTSETKLLVDSVIPVMRELWIPTVRDKIQESLHRNLLGRQELVAYKPSCTTVGEKQARDYVDMNFVPESSSSLVCESAKGHILSMIRTKISNSINKAKFVGSLRDYMVEKANSAIHQAASLGQSVDKFQLRQILQDALNSQDGINVITCRLCKLIFPEVDESLQSGEMIRMILNSHTFEDIHQQIDMHNESQMEFLIDQILGFLSGYVRQSIPGALRRCA